MKKSVKIPVTIITGHLGSGKTTLINKVLRDKKSVKFALIENEYGRQSIDSKILNQKMGVIYEANEGCICCSIKNKLSDLLSQFIKNNSNYDHLLIEATGVANPSKILEVFSSPSLLASHFSINSVICVIDALNFNKHCLLPEFQNQILVSDKIYLSKSDLVTPAATKTIKSELKYINETEIVSINNTDDSSHLSLWFLKKTFLQQPKAPLGPTHSHNYETVTIELEGQFDPSKFEAFFNALFIISPAVIIRTKGIIYFKNAPFPYIFQGVYSSMDFTESSELKSLTKSSKLTFIGKKLNKENLKRSLTDCLS
jgi:G3E family GTPase